MVWLWISPSCPWWSGAWSALATRLIDTILGHTAHASICLRVLQGTPEPVLFAARRSCHDTQQLPPAEHFQKKWVKTSLGETAGSTSRSALELSNLLLSDSAIHEQQLKGRLLCSLATKPSIWPSYTLEENSNRPPCTALLSSDKTLLLLNSVILRGKLGVGESFLS